VLGLQHSQGDRQVARRGRRPPTLRKVMRRPMNWPCYMVQKIRRGIWRHVRWTSPRTSTAITPSLRGCERVVTGH